MFKKTLKLFRNQKGFTLIELITVLVILGAILGIGVPRYLLIQRQAVWDADQNTIKNFAHVAELYAIQGNIKTETESFEGAKVGINELIAAGLIDGDTMLSSLGETIDAVSGDCQFEFDGNGYVANLPAVVTSLIGERPGTGD
jgi:type IV pilus assembly protein PilA